MRKRDLQARAWMALYNFAGVALFPRAVRFFYPPLFRTPAGLALHVTWRVTYACASFRWIRPHVIAHLEREAHARDALVAHLGREPTEEELIEDYGRRRRTARAERGRSAVPGR
jgi:hypothetical protein